MKTPERVLTEVAEDEIRFDYGDAPGTIRLYTRDAFGQLVTGLRHLAYRDLLAGEKADQTLTSIWTAFRQYLTTLKNSPTDPPDDPREPIESFFTFRNIVRFESAAEVTQHLRDLNEQKIALYAPVLAHHLGHKEEDAVLSLRAISALTPTTPEQKEKVQEMMDQMIRERKAESPKA